MSDGVRNAASDALVTAIEANTRDAFTRWGRALGAEFHESAEVQWFVSGVPLQLWNSVVRAQLAAGDVDERIDAVLQHFADRRVPMSWLVGPSTRPSHLGQILERHGMMLDGEAPGMAIDLAQVLGTEDLPPGLTIAEVDEGGALARWIETLVAGNGFPATMRAQLLGLYERQGFRRSPSVRYFLGSLDGMPVATSLLFLTADVAGIYCVGTVPSARGQGIGSAMSAVPLQVARGLGCSVGVLQSSQMGLNIYRRLGFEQYCTVALYFGGSQGASE